MELIEKTGRFFLSTNLIPDKILPKMPSFET